MTNLPQSGHKDSEILSLLASPQTHERGFRLLMSQYQEMVYRHVRRMVTSHEDADDVVQNVFVKVFRNVDGFKGESKLFTWLYKIATNETLTHIRRNQRRGTEFSDGHMEAKGMHTSDFTLDEDKTLALLDAAIGQLPDRQRMVFNMRYYDELSYEQISEILDVSVGALKASFHHAVKKVEIYVKMNF